MFYEELNSSEKPIVDMYEKIVVFLIIQIADRDENIWKNDIEIDFMNKKRHISAVLTDVETILYGYSQDVTIELLENMKGKYEETLKDQSMEETEINEEELLDFPQLMKE